MKMVTRKQYDALMKRCKKAEFSLADLDRQHRVVFEERERLRELFRDFVHVVIYCEEVPLTTLRRVCKVLDIRIYNPQE